MFLALKPSNLGQQRHGQTYEVGKSSSNMCVLNRSSRGSDSGFSPKHPTREILEALILAQEALFGSKKAYGEQACWGMR